jgi:hypothetical protein
VKIYATKMIHGCLPTVSHKQNKKNVGVENVEDNDEDVNQFEEMPLFTNPINIKHIEKDFDKNLMLYM